MQKFKLVGVALIVAFLGLAFAISAHAAPPVIYQRTILPESDSAFDLGTSTNAWRNFYIDQICFTADTCRTFWPTGGSGGDKWATSTDLLSIYPNTATKIVVGGKTSGALATVDLYDQNGTGWAPFIRYGGNPGGDQDFYAGRITDNDGTSANDFWSIGASTTTPPYFVVSTDGRIGIGIGSTTPGATLDVKGVAGVMPLRIASTTGNSLLEVENNGNVGIGSSTPYSALGLHVLNGNIYPSNHVFVIASSTATATTTLLSVSNTGALTALAGISGTTGTFSSTVQGGPFRCGTAATTACTFTSTNSTAPTTATLTLGLTSGAGVGLSQLRFSTSGMSLGTTTGASIDGFTIGSSSTSTTFKPQLVLTDSAAGTDLKHFSFTSANGNLDIGSMTDGFATTSDVTILANGNVGIGSTSPGSTLAVQGKGTFGTGAASTPQLEVLGGTGGNGIIRLNRAGTGTIFDWALTGGGLAFIDNTGGANLVTTNIFSSGGVNQLYLGQSGQTNINTRSSLLSGTVHASAAGTDVAGQNLAIQGGLGTGAGVPGDVVLQTGTALGTGSTVQSGTVRLTVKATTGNVGIGSTTPGTLLSIGNTGGINLNPTATSTFGSSANGINITNGCYAINGVCVGGGSGSVTSVTGTYPVISSGGSTPAISLAFGTTTSNTWAGTQTFTNNPVLGALTGVIYGNSGVLAQVATSSVSASTGISFTGTAGALVGGTALTITNTGVISNSCPGGFLSCSGTNPSTFTLGTLGTANGGTGTSTPGIEGQVVMIGPSGTVRTATSTIIISTASKVGIGSSTPGSLFSIGGNATGTNFNDNATTSKSGVGGYNITNGCFALNGTCIGGGSSASDYQAFTADGTWTKPAAATGNELVVVQAWGGGGAGGSQSGSGQQGGGGGGGHYAYRIFKASALGATETVDIGDAVTGNGATGNNTTFGTWVTAYGGGGGPNVGGGGGGGSAGGGGGGFTGQGNSGAADGGSGGAFVGTLLGVGVANAAGLFNVDEGGGGGGDSSTGNAFVGGASKYGGGGGGGGNTDGSGNGGAGGASQCGGGGGGGAAGNGSGTVGAGGVSQCGGNGGAGSVGAGSGAAGTAPGGGGGGSFGTGTQGGGARGEVRVWVLK